jgi:dGTPase
MDVKEELKQRKTIIEEDEDWGIMGDILTENPFIADSMKIRDSKAFRRLATKAQIFSLPPNPHVRTRLIHTEEVTSTATVVAQRLSSLNVSLSLCQSIALGHDLGHSPFGHYGEQFISQKTGIKFKHEIFSVIISNQIERNGRGLNLTRGTLEGILYHSKRGASLDTPRGNELKILSEFLIVMFCDKISYTFSDLNDAFNRGYVKGIDFPELANRLGSTQRERMARCITALVNESLNKGHISFRNSETAKIFVDLRQWMYDNVYGKNKTNIQGEILNCIFEFFSNDSFFQGCDPAVLLALLTDREANELGKIFLENRFPIISDLANLGVMELVTILKKAKIDLTDPKIDW